MTSAAPSPLRSTLPDTWARVRVARRDRVVDVDKNARVSVLVSTRQRNSRTGSAGATARDGDLRAGNVELRTALAGRGVNGNVLGAQQVVAGRQGLGDRESVLRQLLGGEVDLAGAEGWAQLGDLEPGSAAVGRAGLGDFGHVEGFWTLV